MSDKSLLFVVCTEYSKADFKLKSETYKFFSDNNLEHNTDYVVFYENKVGLSAIYNKFLTSKYADRIVVFLHDDIIIGYHVTTLKRELNKAHQQFDVVGLAGATKIGLTFPTLWHLMKTGPMSGSVGHGNSGWSQMSNYGPSPARCIVVDGLFISVNVERLLAVGHKFDERFKFHHYDLDFCIQANSCGLKIGTWPIWVTHLSPGLLSLENESWKMSNEMFCQKYEIA
jgi:GT2 family glycosyltransferase